MNGIEQHQEDYKKEAWKQYTINELGAWIYLFHKRSSHRKIQEKARKDLHDAKNYLWMIEQQLKQRAGELGIEYSSL